MSLSYIENYIDLGYLSQKNKIWGGGHKAAYQSPLQYLAKVGVIFTMYDLYIGYFLRTRVIPYQ